MKKTITVKQSVQVIQIGQPEKWNMFQVEEEIDSEKETTEQANDRILAEIEASHEKHSKSFIETQIAPRTKRETFEDLKNELNVANK